MMIRTLLLLLTLLPLAAGAAPEEGKEYELIIPEAPTLTSTDKVEVVEVFWYGCPHCYRFQPAVKRWLEKGHPNVEWVRMPAVLNEHWEIHARAFYAAQALGILEKTHQALFDAIHKARRKLNTEESLAAFYKDYGVSEEDFIKTMHSFAVESKVRRARELDKRYNLHSTPSIVINGKYRIDPGMVEGNAEQMLDVVDFLVARESHAGS